jgi:pimeloyl-ACP methyl ester carboxylesterase
MTARRGTLRVPGARLHDEVRGRGPVLMVVGLPRDSADFAPVAAALADRYTVVTYDPRGISRSTLDDPDEDAAPELIATTSTCSRPSRPGPRTCSAAVASHGTIRLIHTSVESLIDPEAASGSIAASTRIPACRKNASTNAPAQRLGLRLQC